MPPGTRSPAVRPEVAVVIPTWRRETRLAFALDALAEQTIAPERFEVLVVRAQDDHRTGLAAAPEGLNVRFLESPVAGPAAQRNIGWRAAEAGLIAFTDDDCRPSREWLERLLGARRGPGTILQGRTEPDPDERHLYWGLARSWEITSPNLWYATCNLAYPRELLEELGGFDERFRAAWGEDTDLGLRARERGAAREYVEGALVWHAVLPRSVPGALREAARHDATPVVVARHPIHRQDLYWGFATRYEHVRLLVALAGLAVLRRWPLVSLLASLQYLRRKVDPRSRPATRIIPQLARLPVSAALDAIETLVTIRSAIRNRVFVV